MNRVPLLALAALPLLTACPAPRDAPAAPAPAAAFYATRYERTPSPAELARVGRALFHAPSLSASGKTACASCHDPAHAYGPPNALAMQRAGASGDEPGTRTAPSLRYLHQVPAFTEHMHDSDGDDSIDQGAAGGHTWDGRARNAHEQAAIPLLSRVEMGNADEAEVVRRVREGPVAPALREAFGEHVLDDPRQAFNAITLALEVFQQEPREFYPFDSKYDAVLRGQAKLDAREAHGLALFNDPQKGNCASCHPSAVKAGAFPVFSDWGFIALGVPRNAAIAANADRSWFDLGLCGPARTDFAGRADYCGRFRTPSLRNVALRHAFFHNGRATSLEQAVRFYVERDTRPAKWYPRAADGKPRMFDDLPAPYRDNVQRDAPFGAGKPRLDAGEIRDVVAFLETLTDGYRVNPP